MNGEVKLSCGHEVKWNEWSLDGDYPTEGRWAWCEQCQDDTTVAEVDPADYLDKPGQLITQGHEGHTEWHVDIEEFPTPDELVGALEQTGLDNEDYAVYGHTVFATDRAIGAALKIWAELQRDAD